MGHHVVETGRRIVDVAEHHMVAAAGYHVVETEHRIVGGAEHCRRRRRRVQHRHRIGVYLRPCCRTRGGSVIIFLHWLKGTYAFVDTTKEELGVPMVFGQGETLSLPLTGFHLKVYSG